MATDLPRYVWADPEPVTGYPEYRVAVWRDGRWCTTAAALRGAEALDVAQAWADEYVVQVWLKLPGGDPTLYRHLDPAAGSAA